MCVGVIIAPLHVCVWGRVIIAIIPTTSYTTAHYVYVGVITAPLATPPHATCMWGSLQHHYVYVGVIIAIIPTTSYRKSAQELTMNH